MQIRDTFCFAIFLAMTLSSSSAYSKSKKYDRQKPAEPAAQSDPKADGKASTGDEKSIDKPKDGAAVPSGDQKVDLTNLENQYWTAKDTEFTVVQNRLYTKEKRFSVMPTFGTVLTDPYTNNFNMGLAANYYFSEREGVELVAWKTASSNTELVLDFKSRFGAIPDHNFQRGFVGINYNWVPVYAKLSLLGKQILYFDFSISPGLGITFLEAETISQTPGLAPPEAPRQAALTLALDASQQVFISKHWALKIDLRNHIYQERVYKAENASVVKNKTTYSGAVMLGVTFFQ